MQALIFNFARLLPIVQAVRLVTHFALQGDALLQRLRQSLAWYVLQSSLPAVFFEDLNSTRVGFAFFCNSTTYSL
jgi:hypothetical protein